jgi:hypothetical protein
VTVTATKKYSIQEALNRGDLNDIAQALALIQIGEILEVQEWDSGTITASATVTPPGECLLIQSIHVVSSGTGASVGHYLPGNSTSTPLLPPGGANAGVGIATVSADGKTITLPNTVTRVIVRYIKKPAKALTADFATS